MREDSKEDKVTVSLLPCYENEENEKLNNGFDFHLNDYKGC